MSRRCHLYIGILLPQKESLSPHAATEYPAPFSPLPFPFFLLEVRSFLGGHINLNRDRFANEAFAGFLSDSSVLTKAD